MEDPYSHSYIVGFGVIALELLIFIPLLCHMFPGPMAPGSSILITATLILAGFSALKLMILMSFNIDPFAYGSWYSFCLMVLCVEVWFREDPELFNGSQFKGYPVFLFHQPGGNGTKATVPMAPYTRIFGTWHAGGVCLCFFMHVLGSDFPLEQKAQTALALGLLWVIWATINQWRSIFGEVEFCQMGILFHSLTGPGCGLCGYWMLHFWHKNRTPGNFTSGELVLWSTVVVFMACAAVSLKIQQRHDPMPANSKHLFATPEDEVNGSLIEKSYGSTHQQ